MTLQSDIHRLRNMPVNQYTWFGKDHLLSSNVVAKRVNADTGKVARCSLWSELPKNFYTILSIVSWCLLTIFSLSPVLAPQNDPWMIAASALLGLSMTAIVLFARVFSPPLATMQMDPSRNKPFTTEWTAYRLNRMKSNGAESLQLYSNSLESLVRQEDPRRRTIFVENGGLGVPDSAWNGKPGVDVFTWMSQQPIKGSYGENTTPPPSNVREKALRSPSPVDAPALPSISPRKKNGASNVVAGASSRGQVNSVEAVEPTKQTSATMEEAVKLDPRLGLLSELMKHGDDFDEWNRWNLNSIHEEMMRATAATNAILTSPLATKEQGKEAREQFSAAVEIVLPQLDRLRDAVVESLSMELTLSRGFLQDKFGEPGERLQL